MIHGVQIKRAGFVLICGTTPIVSDFLNIDNMSQQLVKPFKFKDLVVDIHDFSEIEPGLRLLGLKDLNSTIDQLFEALKHLPPDAAESCLNTYAPYFGVVWPSALGLARRLPKSPQGTWVELGAGLGLPSFILAKRGASQVICSDEHPFFLEFFSKNLALNTHQSPEPWALHKPRACLQSWGELNVPEAWRSFGLTNPPDGIVGSDLLYESHHPEALVQALKNLSGPATQILITDPHRPYLPRFIKTAESSGFIVTEQQNTEGLRILTMRQTLTKS